MKNHNRGEFLVRMLEAERAHVLHGLGRPWAGAAMHHDQGVFVGFEFVEAVGELLERNQRAAEMSDGVLALLAYVKDEGRSVRIHQRFQLLNRDFGYVLGEHGCVGGLVQGRGAYNVRVLRLPLCEVSLRFTFYVLSFKHQRNAPA